MNQLPEAVELLGQLIATPSFSNEEGKAADIWEEWLYNRGANPRRFHNNVFALSENFNADKPILLLNSHIDTVKPVSTYTRNPFSPDIEHNRLYGLGSNDAGASGVTLALTFLKMKNLSLPFNLILALTAAEEKMGELGMRAFLPYLRDLGIYPSMAIVGEPTEMQPAIAERGLVVIDATVPGKAGHAARNEGENAIYRAIEDINLLRNFKESFASPTLGPIKISITMIDAGVQHNVVPDICKYVVDVRTTDAMSNQETVGLLQKTVKWSALVPRSLHISSSVISENHPLVKSVKELELKPFHSPTTSDMAIMTDIPSLKIGPGNSNRSHMADEYIELSELQQALNLYPQIISNIKI